MLVEAFAQNFWQQYTCRTRDGALQCPDGQDAPPWETASNRLVSWWDVERFAAEDFVSIASWLERNSARLEHYKSKSGTLSTDESKRFETNLKALRTHCQKIALRDSLDRLDEVIAELAENQHPTYQRMSWHLKEQADCIRRELKRTLFLHVPFPDADHYLRPHKGWLPIMARFEDAEDDIIESEQCLALERQAAAVFHIMLVAEIGIFELGKLFVHDDPKPGWSAIINRGRQILQQKRHNELTDAEKLVYPILEQLLPLMLAMEDAWRNKISHAANRLVLSSSAISPQRAKDILSTTKAFMYQLAKSLPEKARL
jgi:hypothetical protein